MPRKLRQLRADLKAGGAYVASQEGSHQKWRHPKVAAQVELAGNDGKDAKHYQEKEVKQFLQLIREAQND
jgi:predicted RNA binding protein YcfA (HicA-like mRNA interferase family)